MHSQEQELQRYFDGELGAEEKAKVEKHLAECSTCRTRLGELQALTTVLQSWTLSPDLAQLKRPLLLPARKVKSQVDLSLIGWIFGLMIVLLFAMTRAIFSLSNQLNWVARLASTLRINGRIEQLTSHLWNLFSIQPFYLSHLGELGEGIILILGIMLPYLFYGLILGAIAVLYFNWFSLTWTFVGRSNTIRS
jgi:hypothetical protein